MRHGISLAAFVLAAVVTAQAVPADRGDISAAAASQGQSNEFGINNPSPRSRLAPDSFHLAPSLVSGPSEMRIDDLIKYIEEECRAQAGACTDIDIRTLISF